jgi:Flp pilus assembly protein TadD
MTVFFAIIALLFLQGCTAHKNNPHDEDTSQRLTHEGFALYAQGQYQQAQDLFQSAIRKNPKSKSRFYLGKLYMDIKDISKAQDQLQKALEHDNTDPEILNALAITYDMQGIHHKAQNLYLQAITYADDKTPFESNLGLSYAFDKKYKQALQYLTRHTKTTHQRHNLALVYALMKDYKKFHNLLKNDLANKDIKDLFSSIHHNFKVRQ